MTQTKQIPMMKCEEQPEGDCLGGVVIPDCPDCKGTGKVIDLDRIKADIAGVERSCPCGCHDNIDNECLNSPDTCCMYSQMVGEEFRCKVPMFEGLRKRCPCFNNVTPTCTNCLSASMAVSEPVHTITCSDCHGKGYTSDFTLEELLEATPIAILPMASGDYRAVMKDVKAEMYEHPKPMTAACVATWLALEVVE